MKQKWISLKNGLGFWQFFLETSLKTLIELYARSGVVYNRAKKREKKKTFI